MENQNFICGKNAVLELLKNSGRNINKIIISKGLNRDYKIDEILNLAKQNSVLFQFVPKEKFQQWVEEHLGK